MTDDQQLLRTIERKQAHVLATDDTMFVAELRAFLRWALAHRRTRDHVFALLEPPEEVAGFLETAPRLIAEAGEVAAWLRAKAPEVCAEAVDAETWEEFERIVDAAQATSSPELSDTAGAVFATLRAAREAVGRTFKVESDDEKAAAFRAAVDLGTTYDYRVKERDFALHAAPGPALTHLVALCRAMAPPPEGTEHWTDFAPVDAVGRFSVMGLQHGFRADPGEIVTSARAAFRRFVEGLMTSLEAAEAGRFLLARFKERASYLDRDHLRDVAETLGADGLGLELARWVHDAGVSVVTPAAPCAPRPGAVRGRVVCVGASLTGAGASDADDAAGALRALGELHRWVASLDASAFEVRHALFAVFSTGGAVLELPASLRTERYTIHTEAVDLAADAPTDGGRAVVRVSLEDARAALG